MGWPLGGGGAGEEAGPWRGGGGEGRGRGGAEPGRGGAEPGRGGARAGLAVMGVAAVGHVA